MRLCIPTPEGGGRGTGELSVPIRGTSNDGTTISLILGTGVDDIKSVVISVIRGAQPDSQGIANAIATNLQQQVDVKQPRSGLPNDDPDKTTNPNRPDLFWDGPDLIGRAIDVYVNWVGGEYVVQVRKVGM